jgi:hypothetical protein
MVLELIVILLVDPSLNTMFVPLLAIELDILAPSWAIYDVPTHMIYAIAWERYVVLYQI